EVVGTEVLELNGILYPTYVVKEHAFSDGMIRAYGSGDPMEYTETKWYNPESGLVLKSVRDWIQGLNKGEQEEYSLARVRFPQGTKTHVLAGTKVPGEADARLLAEIARLKRALQDPGFGAPERPAQVAAVQPARKIEPANIPDIEFGRYHALVIGIGNYKHLPRLKTAVNDAKAVADVLRQDYGFTVKLLLDPARDDIVDTLDEYRAALDQTDNLLIYYAGHGWLDEESDRGYWLAADARPNRRSKWVSNATITDTLKTLQAKHVMVVADSCYSGTLIRGAPVGLRSGNYWRRMAKKRARVALTSGGLEPVEDIGGGGHSPFATAFIGVLKGNAAVMDGTTLFNEVRRPVMLSADQTPEYSDVRRAGHDGGDFLFVRRR
ncbi:MAG: caspase family protein, partial [Proteobacteria bacterium]|nr:caspase family protein [Pseudomonadota bacterium]